MNTGQIMLVLAAFTLLAMLALSVNRTMYGSVILGLEMEATLNALSIGQSMLDEAMQKNFDQKTINKVVYSPSEVTSPADLGPETGEAIAGIDSAYMAGEEFHDFKSKTAFNDVDDYHLYHRRVWNARLGYFDVIDSVKYVKESEPSTQSSGATFYKVVVVVVTHPNLPRASSSDTASAPIILRDISVYRQYF